MLIKFRFRMLPSTNSIKAIATIAFILILLNACNNSIDSGGGRKPVYVKPSIDYKGRFRQGHVRMPVSINKNAIKNQNRSKYYYRTRGKYRR